MSATKKMFEYRNIILQMCIREKEENVRLRFFDLAEVEAA